MRDIDTPHCGHEAELCSAIETIDSLRADRERLERERDEAKKDAEDSGFWQKQLAERSAELAALREAAQAYVDSEGPERNDSPWTVHDFDSVADADRAERERVLGNDLLDALASTQAAAESWERKVRRQAERAGRDLARNWMVTELLCVAVSEDAPDADWKTVREALADHDAKMRAEARREALEEAAQVCLAVDDGYRPGAIAQFIRARALAAPPSDKETEP